MSEGSVCDCLIIACDRNLSAIGHVRFWFLSVSQYHHPVVVMGIGSLGRIQLSDPDLLPFVGEQRLVFPDIFPTGSQQNAPRPIIGKAEREMIEVSRTVKVLNDMYFGVDVVVTLLDDPALGVEFLEIAAKT